MVQEVVLNGRPLDLDYYPSLEVGANPLRRTPIEINGKMVHGVNINGYDYPPADPNCVLYLPGLPGQGLKIWNRAKGGSAGDGTIYGPLWVRQPGGIWALDFDGQDDYVEIPAAYTQLNFTTQDFSIIARIYIDNLTEYCAIFWRGRSSFDGYGFYVHHLGYLYGATSQIDANQYSYSKIGSITAGTRFTVGMSRDGSSIKVFRNGIDITQTHGVHINPTTCVRTAKIGIWDNLSSWPFDGKIEFLRVFRGIALPASTHLAWHKTLIHNFGG